VLIELGVVEQRHKAVLEVMEGLTVTDVALRYGVTRQTLHRWLRWYAQGGIGDLADSSSRPATCPHQMAPEVEARIVEMRSEHPGWGPRTLRHYLAREDVEPLPSRSSVYRCLVRHRLIEPQKRRRKREDYRRWERLRPMELWQMDVMGGVRLEDGRELKVVTGIDDHSRFCVCAHLTPRATARPVCEAFLAAMRRYGVPEQVLTDDGKVFTARFGRGSGMVLYDRLCRENGVRHLLTAPRSPTTTGKVERFHKTVRAELLTGRVFASIEEAQAELDAWVAHYNAERPHQGIGMVAPAARFALAGEPLAPVVPLEETAVEPPPALRPLLRRRGGRGGRGGVPVGRAPGPARPGGAQAASAGSAPQPRGADGGHVHLGHGVVRQARRLRPGPPPGGGRLHPAPGRRARLRAAGSHRVGLGSDARVGRRLGGAEVVVRIGPGTWGLLPNVDEGAPQDYSE
jgi:transposase InsO family protein